MAFKMKGHSLPGINQKGYKSKINEGKPGAPKAESGRKVVEDYASGKKEVTVGGDTRSAAELLALANKAEKEGNKEAAKKMRAKANNKKSEKVRAQDFLNKA
tara:strand:+ start:1495 stop:1800 length:306 start_codon:yes stop_codon:yes gene_type:complete